MYSGWEVLIMKKCKHTFKSVNGTTVTTALTARKIEKLQCTKCDRWIFLDKKTRERINFQGGLGEEVENDFK